MLEIKELEAAISKGAAEQRRFSDLDYIRFRSTWKGVERGTVIAKGQIFPGFPHIKRIFTLEQGLAKNISSAVVFAEEKIDGYNLRCVSIDGKIYGLSRGGIIDAFSTEKLRELVPATALENVMLCGEMIGNTPYTPPTDKYDVKYYIFDIYDLRVKRYYAPAEKYAFLKKFKLEAVPALGKFDKSRDIKKIKELVLNLNKANKEGVVFKSEDRSQVIKYVNPNADIEDIGKGIVELLDLPSGYIVQRLLRSAIFVREYGLDRKEYAAKLGAAVYENFSAALKMLEKENELYSEFEILVSDAEGIWADLKSHMGKEVRLEKVFEREENGKVRIRFKKIYVKTSKKLREFLNGKGIID